MSTATYSKKRNQWRIVLPLPNNEKKIEWFNTEEEAEAVRLRYFHEDPFGIHIRGLGWGSKADQAAYRAELDRAEPGTIDEETRGIGRQRNG